MGAIINVGFPDHNLSPTDGDLELCLRVFNGLRAQALTKVDVIVTGTSEVREILLRYGIPEADHNVCILATRMVGYVYGTTVIRKAAGELFGTLRIMMPDRMAAMKSDEIVARRIENILKPFDEDFAMQCWATQIPPHVELTDELRRKLGDIWF